MRLARPGETPDWVGVGSAGEHGVKLTFPNAAVHAQAREWEEAVRRNFGYYAVLFTPEPSFAIPDKPPGPLARSRKRIYQFDTERVAQLRMILPEARMFLIGTAGAIDAHCPEKQTLSPSLYYCRL